MDKVERALVLNENVFVTAIYSKDLVQKARDIHNLSNTATAALGRALTATVFLCSGLKGENEKVTATIDGKGPLGKIITAGDYGCKVRGIVDNPKVELVLNDKGKFDVGKAVGKDGFITVIKDLGLKDPYIGKTELVSGEIAEDFTYYLLKSQQQPSAVALGVLIKDNKVISAGGIIVQIMPNCPDHIITVVEDIVTNFNNISSLLIDNDARQLIDNYFGQFDIKYLEPILPLYQCSCNKAKADTTIKNLGEKDVNKMIEEDGSIEIVCEFCNTKYRYNKEDVQKIFQNN